jgi:hypothetical protein
VDLPRVHGEVPPPKGNDAPESFLDLFELEKHLESERFDYTVRHTFDRPGAARKCRPKTKNLVHPIKLRQYAADRRTRMPTKEGIEMAKHGGLTLFAQSLIEYMEDLITASPKEQFSKIEVLILFNAVKNDTDLLALLESWDAAWDERTRPATYNE